MADSKYLLTDRNYELTIGTNTFKFQKEQKIESYTYSLQELSYDKGIYRPAEMTVIMSVTGKVEYKNLTEAFHLKPVSLKIKGDKDGKDTTYIVAENYFVFKVKPTFQGGASDSAKLELNIYSQDKLMTLDKYSKAWTGQKLVDDILKNEIDNFKYGGKTIGYETSLQILAYGSSSKDEFIQPYLVQYNESFYDFLSRTACRCGEFLYHELGKLHLGITGVDKTDEDIAGMAAERYYEDIASQGTNTTDYGYNYLKKHADPGVNPYSDPLTYDDYLDDVPAQYTDGNQQMDILSKNIVSALCMALEGTSLSNIVANLSTHYACKEREANVIATNLNAVYEEINKIPFSQKNPDQTIRQFGTAPNQSPSSGFASNINLNSEFYSMVRKAEKKVSEVVVYLEFGDKIEELSIGDRIKVDDVKYLVIGVKGGCSVTKENKYEERQQVAAVRLYGDSDICIPPAMPFTSFRESQPQLAFVKENFDPQKIGRVRVRFAWQPSSGGGSDASPWIRVAMPFATDGAGVKFKPEVGDEVMVSFEEGNMERPYVTGFLLGSRSNKSWEYPIPDRTITSKNGHNITFNDGLDGGSFYYGLFPGLKLIKSFIPNATWPNVLEDSVGSMALTGGMTLSDRYGLYKIALSTDSRTVLIQSAMGEVMVNAFTGITISAPNGNIDLIGKNINIKASNKVNIESGGAVKNRFVPPREKYKEGMLEVENKSTRIALDVVLETARAAVNRTIEKAIDLKLVRTVMEMFMRPIDGTTKIKSFTFVQIEAGKGSTEYPLDARKENDPALAAHDLHYSIAVMADIARSRVDAVHSAFVWMCRAIKAFNDISGKDGPNSNEKHIKFNDIKNASYQSQQGELQYKNLQDEQEITKQYNDQLNEIKRNKPKKDDDKYKNKSKEEGQASFQNDLSLWDHLLTATEDNMRNDLNESQEIKSTAEDLSKAINALYVATHEGFNSDVNLPVGNLYFKKDIRKVVKHMEFTREIPIKKGTTENTVIGWANRKKHYIRAAVYMFLVDTKVPDAVNCSVLKFQQSQKNKDGLDSDNAWNDLVDDVVKKSKTRMDKAKDNMVALKEWAANTYKSPFTDAFVNKNRWQTGVEGKILFSENSEKTYSFDKNGASISTKNVTFTDRSCEELKRFLKTIGQNIK